METQAFEEQVLNFAYSYDLYSPYFDIGADNPLRSRQKPVAIGPDGRALGTWSWDAAYQWWFIVMPGPLPAEGIAYAFWYETATGARQIYPDARTAIVGIGTAMTFWAGSDFYGLAEAYEIGNLGHPTAITVSGGAICDVNGVQWAAITLSALGDLRWPYPLSGTLSVAIAGLGSAVATFNGTSRIPVVVTAADGRRASLSLEISNPRALVSW